MNVTRTRTRSGNRISRTTIRAAGVGLVVLVTSLVNSANAQAAANPCWSGALCMWVDAGYSGNHKTLRDQGTYTLAQFGMGDKVSSACNNTRWTAKFVNVRTGLRDDNRYLSPGTCISNFNDIGLNDKADRLVIG